MYEEFHFSDHILTGNLARLRFEFKIVLAAFLSCTLSLSLSCISRLVTFLNSLETGIDRSGKKSQFRKSIKIREVRSQNIPKIIF